MLTKRTAFAALAALTLNACAEQGPATSELKIDAAHSIGVDGIISNGVIRTRSTSNASIERQIRAQLQYMTGQLKTNFRQGLFFRISLHSKVERRPSTSLDGLDDIEERDILDRACELITSTWPKCSCDQPSQ